MPRWRQLLEHREADDGHLQQQPPHCSQQRSPQPWLDCEQERLHERQQQRAVKSFVRKAIAGVAGGETAPQRSVIVSGHLENLGVLELQQLR